MMGKMDESRGVQHRGAGSAAKTAAVTDGTFHERIRSLVLGLTFSARMPVAGVVRAAKKLAEVSVTEAGR
jgi:hypothetical protein